LSELSFDRVSLAQWSLHRAIHGGELRGLDFPRFTVETFGLRGVELVNTLLESSTDEDMTALRRQAEDVGAEILLVMIDDEGDLAAESPEERRDAVDRHRRWIDIAVGLGCHSMRVNTGPAEGVAWNDPLTDDTVARALDACAESLDALCRHAERAPLAILLENHGGLSSNLPAVVELARRLEGRNFGTLPDFGNCPPDADRYEMVETLMPFARAVSAKCEVFDEDGNEREIDYGRMLDIVRAHGFGGWIGIEFEGHEISEVDGVRACQELLRRLLT